MLGLREAKAVVMAAARFRKTLGHRMGTSLRMVLFGAHTNTERRMTIDGNCDVNREHHRI
jgi:hypothetical protein